MHLGLDFDNTIVNYDFVFHKVAQERQLIPSDLPISKIAVRDYLRNQNQEMIWTLMQADVYGSRMTDATPYPGVLDALAEIKRSGIHLSIVSHKTRYPYLGTQYDLHQAAHTWITDVLGEKGAKLINVQDVYFEETKEAKIKRIQTIECDWFVDDLPEILLAPAFPETVKRVLFDPHAHNHPESHVSVLAQWQDLAGMITQ